MPALRRLSILPIYSTRLWSIPIDESLPYLCPPVWFEVFEKPRMNRLEPFSVFSDFL